MAARKICLKSFDAISETARGTLLFSKRHVAQFGHGLQLVFFLGRSAGIDFHHLRKVHTRVIAISTDFGCIGHLIASFIGVSAI